MDIKTIKKLASAARPHEEIFKLRPQDPAYRAFLHSNDERVRAEHEELLLRRQAAAGVDNDRKMSDA